MWRRIQTCLTVSLLFASQVSSQQDFEYDIADDKVFVEVDGHKHALGDYPSQAVPKETPSVMNKRYEPHVESVFDHGQQAFDPYNIHMGPLPPGITPEIHLHAKSIAPSITHIYNSSEGAYDFYKTVPPAVYDEVMRILNFNEPYIIVEEAISVLNLSRDSKILDVGCGTGLIGRLLAREGFSNIVGIDASENLLSVAESEGNYTELETVFLGLGLEAYPDKYKDRFDVVIGSGVFLAGHFPAAAIEDVVASLKVGGKLVTAMRSLYWQPSGPEMHSHKDEYGFRDGFDQLENQGKIRRFHQRLFKRGIPDGAGLFAQMDSILLVFERLS